MYMNFPSVENSTGAGTSGAQANCPDLSGVKKVINFPGVINAVVYIEFQLGNLSELIPGPPSKLVPDSFGLYIYQFE